MVERGDEWGERGEDGEALSGEEEYEHNMGFVR